MRLTPPPDAWIERVPEAPEDNEDQPPVDFCDSCRRGGKRIARTNFIGRRVCVDCDQESRE